MEQNVVNSLMLQWTDKIPNYSVYQVQEELKSLDSTKAGGLYGLSLKSKVVGLVLGLFLGAVGADRFYKGDKKLGIYKLVLFLVYCVGLIIADIIGSGILVGIAILSFVVLIVWVFVDLFLVWKEIPKDNLRIIQQVIANAH